MENQTDFYITKAPTCVQSEIVSLLYRYKTICSSVYMPSFVFVFNEWVRNEMKWFNRFLSTGFPRKIHWNWKSSCVEQYRFNVVKVSVNYSCGTLKREIVNVCFVNDVLMVRFVNNARVFVVAQVFQPRDSILKL